MANLSSKTGFTPVQTQVSIPTLNTATAVQDFAAYEAQELTGFVYVDAATDLRCSVKVMVVKNGAGTYEVAAVDIAGDNYASAPMVSFSMSGSILRATLPAGIPGFAGTAYIKYQLNAPALGGNFPLTVDSTSINVVDSAPLSYRNKIINGNFDIWQRGTTNTSVDGLNYLADRWKSEFSGSTRNYSRQTFSLGQTAVPNNPAYYARVVVTTSAGVNNFVGFEQRIENVATFAGQTATISFWAKADASKNIAFECQQVFGTGGSPSATVNTIGVTTFALTTSWQKFTATISIPSIAGKTLGTDANSSYLLARLWFDAGSNFNARTNSLGQQSGTFDIAQVQLEVGSRASAFEQRPIGMELSLCQRYYYDPFAGVFTANTQVGMAWANTTTNAWAEIKLPVTMRVAPVLGTLSGAVFAAGYPGSYVFSSLIMTESNLNHVLLNGNIATLPSTAHYGRFYRPGTVGGIPLTAEL